MHQPAYPEVYAVLLTTGRWAVVCEHCAATLAYTSNRADLRPILDGHTRTHQEVA